MTSKPEPGFDSAEYAAAFAPPTCTIDGRRHVGVLLSSDEWFSRVALRVNAVQDDTPQAEIAQLARDITDLSFPRPWWQVWRPRVSALLARLPWGAQMEAVASFTAAQALAQKGRVPGRTTRTDGTGSPG